MLKNKNRVAELQLIVKNMSDGEFDNDELKEGGEEVPGEEVVDEEEGGGDEEETE